MTPTPEIPMTLPDDVVEQFARDVCQDVCELPDRTSPDDWPEACLVTGKELHIIVTERFRAALEAARYGEMRAEIAEIGEVAKGCAKREAQYFADRKELLLGLKRSRIALNLVPANDKRFDPASHAAIKKVTDIIDALLSTIGDPTDIGGV